MQAGMLIRVWVERTAPIRSMALLMSTPAARRLRSAVQAAGSRPFETSQRGDSTCEHVLVAYSCNRD